jgi:carbon-monoxide dehydrogenase large subunit
MEKFGKAQSVKRVEDVRLLTGHGRYIDDTPPPESLFAYVFRAPVAHARVTSLDVSEAEAAPGVQAVLTAERMKAQGMDIHMPCTAAPAAEGKQNKTPRRPMLAEDKLRFVGEPVAVVVAETLAEAKDAAELIELDYEDLPPHLELAPGGEPLHEDAPDNVVYEFGLGDREAVEAAFAEAAHVVEMEIGDNRIMVASMEPRGCHAEWDGERLHFTYGGQGVWGIKGSLARTLGIDKEAVHVATHDVGGGFGMKGFDYPEYFPVAAAAKMLGRPVRWTADRTESMLSDNGGRDLVSHAALAFDADHRILAYRVENLSNIGAYCSTFGQMIQSFLFGRVVMGTYDVQKVWLGAKGILTNTAPVDAYRGAGRPEAIYALERIMDTAARELGVDPWELHAKNFIPADRFPYTTVSGETYDVGDFNRLLSRAEQFADKPGFAARRAESARRGKLRGQGLCYYIESILGSPDETATVEFLEDGTVNLYVGTQSNGQGHETVFAQFLSDQTGIPADLIRVVQGDSDRIAHGGGTGGSRSVTTQNTATLATTETLIAGFSAMLAEEAGVEPSAVSFDDERFRVAGTNLTPTMLEAAEMAREKGRADLLKVTETGTLPGRSYPNGCHVAEVEIDPDTGVTEVVRYSVVDDFGNLINPMLAAGQVHGGVAQGLGQAVAERVVYDETGQLLTATFMDYAMPRATDMPLIDLTFEPVPSTANLMGMKGCGEAGTVGALAAVTNAALDALWERGVRRIDMPLTPQRVWQALQEAGAQTVAAE